MKKLLLGFLAVLLALSVFTEETAKAADDLTGHAYEDEIRELMELGIIEGYNDGTIRPNKEVTRAEFAKMVVQSFELGTAAESASIENAVFTAAATAATLNFKDVLPEKWYYNPIAAAVDAGIIKGYPDNTFKPDELINREQMSTMVSRALTAKGIVINVSETQALGFTDTSTIRNEHKDHVRILSHLGIVTGNKDNSFRPKDSSKRWMVAVVMLRARDEVFPPQNLEFQASAVAADKTTVVKHFDTFAQAKEYVQNNTKVQAVERSNQILWMKQGIVTTNAFTEVYPTDSLKPSTSTFRPYVPANTEMKFIDSTATTVKVELAGKVGYVSSKVVRVIPQQMQKGQSYYEVYGSSLVHKIFNHSTGSYASTGIVGKAPKEFVSGMKYYSWDGATFTNASGAKVAESYQYFNMLPLHTETNYTAEELDKYLQDKFPYYNQTVNGKKWTVSPLVGAGKFFKEMEATHKINALYLLSHAIHESQWGTSKIAQDKFNLFGYGAVDGDAYNRAYAYLSFRESIEDAAIRINKGYQSPTGSYYNGSILGNKGIGMNVRYASDAFWGEKIAGHMFRTDQFLGSKDVNQHKLGYTTTSPLNFRKDPSTSFASLYTLKTSEVPVVIHTETTAASGSLWYEVASEDKAYTKAYVHGNYIKMMPVVQ
ncbi:S-layer protein/ peptidoglycan endo-beta-N-acetylglucosaminidase, putative [Planococcus halocryophilus Or1]|uniref:S-layer protein n=1 Tax=Planococcus halocryophilus TaxID=1215089 RepID=A0A1C7DQX6_9BACL|nr:S-layer homology domain-containing protein [Planococcus halocryophilus]ANU13989.1 S-layer protein [Planococcus halocryophilus]EMF47414.1 S-layer protein/ peptidoglycan endo-beta-N-acetylglucosaminidase, putative [Planococcus halocryophilus Or1]